MDQLCRTFLVTLLTISLVNPSKAIEPSVCIGVGTAVGGVFGIGYGLWSFSDRSQKLIDKTAYQMNKAEQYMGFSLPVSHNDNQQYCIQAVHSLLQVPSLPKEADKLFKEIKKIESNLIYYKRKLQRKAFYWQQKSTYVDYFSQAQDLLANIDAHIDQMKYLKKVFTNHSANIKLYIHAEALEHKNSLFLDALMSNEAPLVFAALAPTYAEQHTASSAFPYFSCLEIIQKDSKELKKCLDARGINRSWSHYQEAFNLHRSLKAIAGKLTNSSDYQNQKQAKLFYDLEVEKTKAAQRTASATELHAYTTLLNQLNAKK